MEIDIRGSHGNAIALMGHAEHWAKQLKWDREAIDDMIKDMQSGDYDHLLDVIEEKFKHIVTIIGREGEDD